MIAEISDVKWESQRHLEYFVDPHSIVRKIWGRSDTILFIFAGAAAEFALSKAVDWLYFTGRLPADPLARLFSTVSYAKSIVFSEKEKALRTIDAMATIHSNVEEKRGASIPDWAYRDVLFMLIDYSIRSFDVLEHNLSKEEKEEVVLVFTRMGKRMGVKGLPDTAEEFDIMRQQHLEQNLQHSAYTDDLFCQYRKHLGTPRYWILREVQALLVPKKVAKLLDLPKKSRLVPLLFLYTISKALSVDAWIRALILPKKYSNEIKAMER